MSKTTCLIVCFGLCVFNGVLAYTYGEGLSMAVESFASGLCCGLGIAIIIN